MASQKLYPAIIDGAMPAFPVLPSPNDEPGDNYCRIYFSLSKFNVTNDFAGVHLSIKKQSTGVSAVKTQEVNIREDAYRATGLLLLNSSLVHQEGDQNLYYVDVLDDDIKHSDGDYHGWLPGVVYQVQIRLSEIDYSPTSEPETPGDPPVLNPQANWLSENANRFSEWSTLCAIKPISQPYLTSSYIGYPADPSLDPQPSYYTTKSADLYFDYNRPVEDKESLYSYQFMLVDSGEVKEQSELMYTTRSENPDVLQYTLTSTDLDDTKSYQLFISFTTLNNYNEVVEIPLRTDFNNDLDCDLTIYTVDNIDSINGHNHNRLPQNNSVSEVSIDSSLGKETEEGYIVLKLIGQIGYSRGTIPRDEYMLRRASSKDNFTHWEDIKHITLTDATYGKDVNIDIKDMTIESGILYKYGVQNMDKITIIDPSTSTTTTYYYRGKLNIAQIPDNEQTHEPEEDTDLYIMREFDHTYLLGENDKQLKLEFDNTMNNLSFNIDDSVQKTYGMFPVVVRPGASRYRTFPVNGLISFYMDENETFIKSRDEVYGCDAKLYEKYDSTRKGQQYNYVYEREFRKKVMQFLQDGRPKLFKSPTEGNILIRISGVSFSPNDTLSRLIYSFSSTGTEIGEVNNKNLTKYKIFNLEMSTTCAPPNVTPEPEEEENDETPSSNG